MSLLKYFGEPGGPGTVHGVPVSWPGTPHGFPLLGPPAAATKDSEFTETPIHSYYRRERYRMWMEEDHARCVDILDRCTNGQFKLWSRQDHWMPDEMEYLIFLEWSQYYGKNQAGPRTSHNDGHPPIQQERSDNPHDTGTVLGRVRLDAANPPPTGQIL